MAAIFASIGFLEISTNTYFTMGRIQSESIAGLYRLFDVMKDHRCHWTNNWVLMDGGLWMETEQTFCEWQDHDEVFVVHLFPGEVHMRFKLLPRGITYKESYGDDGYFVRGSYTPYLNESY